MCDLLVCSKEVFFSCAPLFPAFKGFPVFQEPLRFVPVGVGFIRDRLRVTDIRNELPRFGSLHVCIPLIYIHETKTCLSGRNGRMCLMKISLVWHSNFPSFPQKNRNHNAMVKNSITGLERALYLNRVKGGASREAQLKKWRKRRWLLTDPKASRALCFEVIQTSQNIRN